MWIKLYGINNVTVIGRGVIRLFSEIRLLVLLDNELLLVSSGLSSGDVSFEEKLWKNALAEVIHKLIGRVRIIRGRGIDALSHVDELLEDVDEGIAKIFD